MTNSTLSIGNNRVADSVNDWLTYAQADLKAAELLSQFEQFPTAIHAFHCQQAVEKSLKAFLTARAHPFLYRQNLAYLLELCTELDGTFRELESSLARLAPYTTQAVYPNEILLAPSTEEARTLYQDAHTIVEFVRRKI